MTIYEWLNDTLGGWILNIGFLVLLSVILLYLSNNY